MAASQQMEALATIATALVVDYDHLMAADDIGTSTALRAARRDVIVPLLTDFGARIVQISGDAILLKFGKPADAVSYATMVQRAMMTRNADVDVARQIWLRFGINLGPVVVDGNNLYGEGVDVATRLGVACAPGAVCLSASTEESLRGTLPYPATFKGQLSDAKGNAPLSVFEVQADFIGSLPDVVVPEAERHAPATYFPVREGTQLNDAYELDRRIGTGGMGEIFRGHEIQSGDPVAIKLIRLELVGHGPALALFQKEASVLKHINHEAIVRYYVFSFDQMVRRHYLAMEFVDGPSLSKRLEQGPLPFEAVNALRRRVASGLQVAHERGIVHRDVTPDNIILPDGDIERAKIIDFGIARSATVGGGTIIGGGFAGKYNYVSPEQLGLAGGEVTGKSDMYSFGLVLAEAMTGHPIDMAGTQADTIEKRRTVPDLGAIDARLRPLIARMLQPEPDRRPDSMAEIAAWSPDAVVARPSVSEPRTEVARPASSKPKRGVEQWIIAAALFGVVVLGGGLAVLGLMDHRRAAPISDQSASLTPGPSTVEPKLEPAGPPPKPSRPPPASPPGPVPPDVKPKVADLPVVPQADMATRVSAYLQAYDGGACFFAQAGSVTDHSAGIEAYATSGETFDRLNDTFKASLGFEPDIVGHRVWSRQCPAIDFLRKTASQEPGPSLFLKSTRVRSGQSLAGEISRTDGEAVTLLRVHEDGTVEDVSHALVDKGDSEEFDLPLASRAKGGPFPQLIVALLGLDRSKLPTSLNETGAKDFFSNLLKSASKNGNKLRESAKFTLVEGQVTQ